MADRTRINALFIASEADPFVKVGGLADVAGSLPRALMNITHPNIPAGFELDIRLVIPYHPQISSDIYSPQFVAEYPIRTVSGAILAKAYILEDDGLTVYLIAGEPIDRETGVYSADLEADGYKYVFFSLAALELARQLRWKPDILHANDWHTASAVYSLALHRTTDPFYNRTASLITVHNLPYLGSMTQPAMEAFGLPSADSSDLPFWARQMALPLGLLAADSVIAVSPGYAREILTEEFGSGLEGFLGTCSGKISGILNGIDTHKWDPTTDKVLTRNFSSGNLAERTENKAFLQQEMGLEVNPQVPLLAMITRIDPQKGVDLAVTALRSMMRTSRVKTPRLQMIFLGTGNPVLESAVRQLERDFPDSVRAMIMFDEKLSHQIYSGADILLMPSRYEPCGLSQMISMHYGCIPVARATGGLCDTIQDPADTELSTGFLFTPVKAEALAIAIRRAITMYLRDPSGWQEIQRRAMQQDFSWDRSAGEYLKQYKLLVDTRKNV